MNFKRVMAGSLIGAGMLASPSAFAGATGNVGAFSEYLFRGLETSGGAAVQGGLDYAHESGLYAGTWASNTGGPIAAGGTELDLYGGYSFKLGGLGLDVGAIYYIFPEYEEDGGPESADYPEVYLRAAFSYFAAQLYYTSDFLGDVNESAADAVDKDTDFTYLNLLASFPVSETVTLGLQYGISSGDGIEVAVGDDYSDYSVSLTKTLDAGFAFSFGLYGTTLDEGEGLGTVSGDDDGIKVVVGLKKSFEL